MAENYFPSSTGLGQGGAQVLQGRTPQLSASGIVRGIEQVGKDIREEQAYQKKIELAKAKERNERLNALNETISKIQIPDNTSAAEMVVGEMWNRINKGEDYETVFQESIGNIEKIRKADNFIVQNRENLENKRYWDEESGQYMFAGDLIGNYMDGDISDRDILEEGGVNAYVGNLYGTFDPLSNNWYDMETTDFNKEVVDYLNEIMSLYGEEDAEVISVGGREGIKTTKAIPLDLQEKLYKNIEDNEKLMDVYYASIGVPYRHKSLEEKKVGWKPIVKDIVMPKTEKITGIRQKDDGKGGLNFLGGGKANTKLFNLSTERVTEKIDGQDAFDKLVINITPKQGVSIGSKTKSEFNVDGEVISGTPISIEKYPNEDRLIVNITSKKVNPETFEEEEIIVGVEYDKIKSTLSDRYGLSEDNVRRLVSEMGNDSQAETPQSAKDKEKTSTTEDLKAEENREFSDAEVKKMWGRKVSKEDFRKMTPKQRAKFMQNGGDYER